MDTVDHYRAIKAALHAPYVAEDATAEALHSAYLDVAISLGSLNLPQLKALVAFLEANAKRHQCEATPDSQRDSLTPKKPILSPSLIGLPSLPSLIPGAVQQMLDNEGFYIGSNPADPSYQAPIVSIGGKLYSMMTDQELDPTRFIIGHLIHGPFSAQTPQ